LIDVPAILKSYEIAGMASVEIAEAKKSYGALEVIYGVNLIDSFLGSERFGPRS
jgi:hypothetical protein